MQLTGNTMKSRVSAKDKVLILFFLLSTLLTGAFLFLRVNAWSADVALRALTSDRAIAAVVDGDLLPDANDAKLGDTFPSASSWIAVNSSTFYFYDHPAFGTSTLVINDRNTSGTVAYAVDVNGSVNVDGKFFVNGSEVTGISLSASAEEPFVCNEAGRGALWLHPSGSPDNGDVVEVCGISDPAPDPDQHAWKISCFKAGTNSCETP